MAPKPPGDLWRAIAEGMTADDERRKYVWTRGLQVLAALVDQSERELNAYLEYGDFALDYPGEDRAYWEAAKREEISDARKLLALLSEKKQA